MAYFISDRQHLAAGKERTKYEPWIVVNKGCRYTPAQISYGHPLYVSVCSVGIVECLTDYPLTHPILPDGCISIVFYGRGILDHGMLCGATDRIKKLILMPGYQYLFFKFMPGATASFVDCEISAVTDGSVDVCAGVKNGSRLLSIAEKDLSVMEKALLMSRVLRVAKADKETDYIIRYCIERIQSCDGSVTVSELAFESGFSERYLGKVFEKHIGISPKTYAEIIKIQNSLHILFEGDPHNSLLDIALDSGYFDHAAMKECW